MSVKGINLRSSIKNLKPYLCALGGEFGQKYITMLRYIGASDSVYIAVFSDA